VPVPARTKSHERIDGGQAVLWSAAHSQEVLLLLRNQFVRVTVIHQFGSLRHNAALHLSEDVAQQLPRRFP
jgi:hypothetical protein